MKRARKRSIDSTLKKDEMNVKADVQCVALMHFYAFEIKIINYSW